MTGKIVITDSIFGSIMEAYQWPVGPVDLLNPDDPKLPEAEIDRGELLYALEPLMSQDMGVLGDFPIDRTGLETFEDFLLTGIFDAVLEFKKGFPLQMTGDAEIALVELMNAIVIDGVNLTTMSVEEMEKLREDPQEGDLVSKGFFKKVWRAIKRVVKKIYQSIAGFVVELGKFFIDVHKVEVEEAVATLQNMPVVDFTTSGANFDITNLDVDIKVRVDLKIMGRRLEIISLSKSAVNFHIHGGLEFKTENDFLKMMLGARKANAVIRHSIYGLEITITIGITSILDKAMKRLGWIDIFELSQFHFDPPGGRYGVSLKMGKVQFAQDELQVHFFTRLL